MLDCNGLLNTIFIVPFLGMVFVLIAKGNDKNSSRNILSVGLFTVVSNLIVLWMIARKIVINESDWQMIEKYVWLENPKIKFAFGIDIFSFLLIAAVHFAVLLGMVGIRHNNYRQKSLVAFSLLFLSAISGFFTAADLFSFYIFFEAMLLPLFMLIGMFGDIKKRQVIFRYFLYNLLGAVFLFIALTILYNYRNVGIKEISNVILTQKIEILVWGAIFIAFLSRIPVWPFHYWISSVNANISNPLVFIIANILPLTGVYGLIRFLPVNAPEILAPYQLGLEIISVVTMVMIALIGFVIRDVQYKIFSYMTIYYIFYLLGALLPTDALLLNIGFSLFSYLIIIASIEVLVSHIENMRQCNGASECGILCNTKRISFVMSFLILASVGMPLSSLFLNNMAIFAGLLKFNIKMTVFIFLAVVLISISLLHQLFYWKYPPPANEGEGCMTDLSSKTFMMMVLIMAVLVSSLINPLWFLE
jgi:NADH-quinone oxidoreductase subunit M